MKCIQTFNINIYQNTSHKLAGHFTGWEFIHMATIIQKSYNMIKNKIKYQHLSKYIKVTTNHTNLIPPMILENPEYKHHKIPNSTHCPPYLVFSSPTMHHSKGIKTQIKELSKFLTCQDGRHHVCVSCMFLLSSCFTLFGLVPVSINLSSFIQITWIH